jgi:AraC-like DNA-binding protein
MLFYSSLLTIILSIILVGFNWKVNKSVLYLALFFVAFACYGLTHHFTLYSHSDFWLALFYNHFAPLYLLPGPLLYFYTKESLTDKKAFSNWEDYLHFIPAVINLVAIIPYLFYSFDEKEVLAAQIHSNLETIRNAKINWLYPPIVGFTARPLSMMIYGLLIFIKWFNFNPKKEILKRIPLTQYVFVKNWILLLSLVSFAVAALFLSLTMNFIQHKTSNTIVSSMPLHFSIGIIFCILPITLFLFPKILYGVPISNEIEKVALPKNNIEKKKFIENDADPFQSLSDDILNYLEKEKPFVNSSFSMSHLAVIFNVPQHHIAYCFNHVIKKKFTNLRTEHRVNHAKELLDQDLTNSMSIDGIGIKAGFNTRSSFYSSFKTITGYTPSEYYKLKNLE